MLLKSIVNNFLTGLFGCKDSMDLYTSCYVGLFTSAPSDEDGTGGTEVSGNDYARVKIGEIKNTGTTTNPAWEKVLQVMKNTDPDTGSTLDREFRNQNTIYFPEAYPDGWATGDIKVTHFGLFEKEEGGTPYMWGTLKTIDDEGNIVDEGINIPAKSIPIFRKGDLVVSLKDTTTTT